MYKNINCILQTRLFVKNAFSHVQHYFLQFTVILNCIQFSKMWYQNNCMNISHYQKNICEKRVRIGRGKIAPKSPNGKKIIIFTFCSFLNTITAP